MKKLGQYKVWLTGSKEYTRRIIRKDAFGACFILYYGELIEVVRKGETYQTVLPY